MSDLNNYRLLIDVFFVTIVGVFRLHLAFALNWRKEDSTLTGYYLRQKLWETKVQTGSYYELEILMRWLQLVIVAVIATLGIYADDSTAHGQAVESVKTPITTVIGINDPENNPSSLTISFIKPDGTNGEVVFHTPDSEMLQRIHRTSEESEIIWKFDESKNSGLPEWTPDNILVIRLERSMYNVRFILEQ